MAERKATNKYIPPDFDPKKHKSINGYRNSHPLRQRASKLKASSTTNVDDERIGSLVIRFELPYDAICTHCSKGMAKGTRFNARKKQVGSYGGGGEAATEKNNNLIVDSGSRSDEIKVKIENDDSESGNHNSTTTINQSSSSSNSNSSNGIPIYSFVMKCYDCSGRLEIRTNPEQITYDCVSGLKWRSRALNINDDDDNATGSNNLDPNDTRSEMIIIGQDLENLDAMQRINHEKEDVVKAESAIPQLESLIKLNKRQVNDFELNSKLRDSHRKLRKNEKESCKTLKERLGSNFVDSNSLRSLLPEETMEDCIFAKQELSTRVKKRHIEGTSSTSIFNTINNNNCNGKPTITELLKPDNITRMAKEIKKRKLNNQLPEKGTINTVANSSICENAKWTLQRANSARSNNNKKNDKTSVETLLHGLSEYGQDDDQ